MEERNKFTLLEAVAGGFRGVSAGEWNDELGRRQRLIGMHNPGGGRRLLFGTGEGLADAVAGAKQGNDNGYPQSFVPVLTSANTAALICSGIWGQAATISAKSGVMRSASAKPGLGAVTPRA